MTKSDTPRTDSEKEFMSCQLTRVGLWEEWKRQEEKVRQLERELNEANKEADKEHAKAVELSDKIINWKSCAGGLAEGFYTGLSRVEINFAHVPEAKRAANWIWISMNDALSRFNELKGKK